MASIGKRETKAGNASIVTFMILKQQFIQSSDEMSNEQCQQC
jgi:hypothetical protein